MALLPLLLYSVLRKLAAVVPLCRGYWPQSAFYDATETRSIEDIRATFMADLNLSMTHPEEASVESLANNFEDIALFREFTSQEGLIADGTMDSDETYAWES
ncbi:hypothetical protein FOMA001_g15864 [Fusarium oxysporum f. sp. matthiolae]|nr:hypothetical protein FOMA001_g15864 [Fusarium oxysporum f. sp. matthiolae]